MTSLTTLENLLARFAAAECSWISSVRPDGRVHSVPVWHVWTNGLAYIITKDNTVKVHNIANNPNVVVALPDPLDPFILEGVAQLKQAIPPEIAEHFKVKYDWDPMSDSGYSTLIEIRANRVIAWGKHGDGRWTAADIAVLNASQPNDQVRRT